METSIILIASSRNRGLLFLDIIGKITWKIVGLYAETKLDKVVYKYEQIGIERRDIKYYINFKGHIALQSFIIFKSFTWCLERK